MDRSLLQRLWDAVKPPPSVREGWKPTPRQKRILIATGCALVAAIVATGVWSYIASAPDRAKVQFDWGIQEMGAGANRDAVASFDRSISIWPHNPAAFYNRGVAHHLLGEADAAIADLSRAIEENPRYGQAYTERGRIFEERSDPARAMQDLSHSVDLEPSANGYFQLGQGYVVAGQLQKAVEEFDLAIREQPDAPYIYRARGEAKRRLGDLAGYQADRDLSVKLETGGFPRAWVDVPLPGGPPAETGPPATAVRSNSHGAPAPSHPEAPPSR